MSLRITSLLTSRPATDSADEGVDRRSRRRFRAAAMTVGVPMVVAGLLASGVSSAGAAGAETTSTPGPLMSHSAQTMANALKCSQTDSGRDPILLVHGTTEDDASYDVTFKPLLTARGELVCTVALPENALGRVDVSAEYVAAAVRTLAARYQRPVDLIGHSQGGMILRWAVKWWPDIRTLVDDVIGLAPPNHGSSVGSTLCIIPCMAAAWQQAPDARFIAALNNGDETPGRVSYTVVYSETDEIVEPTSPPIAGEADDSNTMVQTVCPGREVSHKGAASDNVSVSLVLDALDNPGPARASRLPADVCSRDLAEGIDPAALQMFELVRTPLGPTRIALAPKFFAEPALPAYAVLPVPAPRAVLEVVGQQRAGAVTTIQFRALGASGDQRYALPYTTITADGQTATTDSQGLATLQVHRNGQPLAVQVLAPGLEPLATSVA
jgi:triacylglycerol esterase/lipase EstA (alpha/beta hydrolase family)